MSRQKSLEDVLQAQISEVESKIRALEIEKNSLHRALVRARAGDIGDQIPLRRNSGQRMLIEKAVLDFLGNKPSNTKRVFEYVRIVHPSLKSATFRSYLRRMSQRGLIANSARGMWQLPRH